MTTTSPPEQGRLVQVRSRPWVVDVAKPSTLPTPAMQLPVGGTQNLLTLSSVEDDVLGEELRIVWEIEPGAKVVEKVALPEPTDFDAPEKLDAFLDAVRWGPGARTLRAEQRCHASEGQGNPRRNQTGDGSDPGTVRQPAGPHAPRGRDVLGP